MSYWLAGSLGARNRPADPADRGRSRRWFTVSAGISARSGKRGRTIVVSVSSHSLDQMGARRSGLERLTEILGLAGHPAIQEFHDAHRVGRMAVIGEDEFRDPEVARSHDAAHAEALRVRLRGA